MDVMTFHIFPFIVGAFLRRRRRESCRVTFFCLPNTRRVAVEIFQFNFIQLPWIGWTYLNALNSVGLSWVSSMSWTSPMSRARFSAFAVRMGMRLMGVWGFGELDGELDLEWNYFLLWVFSFGFGFWGFLKLN